MRILVFDPRLIGHHVEYLRHLVEYAAGRNDLELDLVVHPEFHNHAASVAQYAERHPSTIHVHPLTPSEFAATERTNTIWSRALAGWEAAATRAQRVEADHCVFMEINAYQSVIGLPRVRSVPFRTSGILFFPFPRIDASTGTLKTRTQKWLNKARKRLQVRWMLSNPQFHTLFVLNDVWTKRVFKETFQYSDIQSLPDPVPPSSTDDASDEERVWAQSQWASKRTHFLIFGSLREGKGIEEAFRAFHSLDSEDASHAALHVLGKPRETMMNALPRLVRDLEQMHPSLEIHYEDRFLSDAELDLALKSSDTVLAPYQRTEGSSGVLGHAAKHRCPVIGPRSGLMGALMGEYSLGMTINAEDPGAIAQALQRSIRDPETAFDSTGMARYVDERSPHTFAHTFFSQFQPNLSPVRPGQTEKPALDRSTSNQSK